MKLFTWVSGRQGSGYYKFCLLNLSWPFKMDAYLIKYPKGTAIPWHKDSAPNGYEHHRLNIVLKCGGTCMESLGDKGWRSHKFPIIKFRSDELLHCVDITKSSRYVLSVGWLKKAKNDYSKCHK